MSPVLRPRLAALTAMSAAGSLMLSACGGGGADGPVAVVPPPAAASAVISGTVAVGAPIAGGTLRIVDADGAVVASNVAIDADGRYAEVALTGPAPYRLEACGQAGPNYLCVYSVASAAGTANVTPLTTATVLLATGQQPDALMAGTAPALTGASVAAAQDQLRTSLASLLSSAGVSSGFDFVSGTLAAGSRTGYDGVLDAVGVSVGQDTQPFVQIVPRLGEGNLYLEQGRSSGSVTAAPAAAGLQLGGLETLFRDMSAALASAAACSSESSGIQRSLASAARMQIDGPPAQGAAEVARGLCGFFAQGEDGNTPMWGARFLSPTLGRCDLSGTAPVCGVSFVLQGPDGDVQPVGSGMAVTQEAGVWKFLGDLLPVQIHASAKAQRTRRIDSATPIDDYMRALAFEVAAVPGLACAKVAQRDAAGASATVGYYKRHTGALEQDRLSLWTADGFGNGASLDPLVGATRSTDDSWIGLPQGAAGDAVIRNFYRGGRSVVVSLYTDAACSVPFNVGGRSEFEVPVEGVPPVWAVMETLPWPEIDATSQAALRSLAIDAGGSGSLHAAWSFARGPVGVNGATVCGSRADCGDGNPGRLGERALRSTARDVTVSLRNTGSAVAADDPKTLALSGRNGEGVDLQSNYSSCPSAGPAEACH
jgi:hypothetical protein